MAVGDGDEANRCQSRGRKGSVKGGVSVSA